MSIEPVSFVNIEYIIVTVFFKIDIHQYLILCLVEKLLSITDVKFSSVFFCVCVCCFCDLRRYIC